jgi:hypothetical protein
MPGKRTVALRDHFLRLANQRVYLFQLYLAVCRFVKLIAMITLWITCLEQQKGDMV